MTTRADLLTGEISAKETAGRITSVTRNALIEFEYGIGELPSLEAAIKKILEAEGLPTVGHEITINGQSVFLEERNARLVDARKGEVVLIYRRQESSDPDDPGNSDITYDGGTNLRQITTELDINGDPITVEHAGDEQWGNVQALDPQSTLIARIVEEDRRPGLTSIAWGGYVNSELWNGGAPGTWLCESVTFEEVDMTADPPKYRLTYTFQYDRDGWQPQVFYTDPETGRPAPGLEPGIGYKTVAHYPEKDFGTKFPG